MPFRTADNISLAKTNICVILIRVTENDKGQVTRVGYTGINLENVKMSNRSAILKLLNDHGAMSRKDIALTLGLTPATVTLICTELLSGGILCERGEVDEEKRAGRKKVLIDINYQCRYVLAISIEAAETTVSVCDLKGNRCGMRRLPTDGGRAPEEFLKKVADEGKALMWESGTGKDQILGVGVSVPGIVRRRTGLSHHAYRIWKEPVEVGKLLEQHFPYPVIVENNVKAFAEGELVYGSGRERENLLFIKWGPGVGSAIIIRNEIYDSENSKSAEIGHFIVEKNGKQCRCGRRGCLETRVSTHAIAEQVRSACTAETMPVLYELVEGKTECIEARNISWWIGTKDGGLERILDEILEQMARTAVNTITLLAPDQVIIYGYMFDLPRLEQRFLKLCGEYDPAYGGEYIQKSRLGEQIEYIGPLAVVMNERFLRAGTVDRG